MAPIDTTTDAMINTTLSNLQNPSEAAPKARDEEIARLAHTYWEERQKNGLPGSDVEDWLRAEAEVARVRDAAIDEASEESFPASDPPAR